MTLRHLITTLVLGLFTLQALSGDHAAASRPTLVDSRAVEDPGNCTKEQCTGILECDWALYMENISTCFFLKCPAGDDCRNASFEGFSHQFGRSPNDTLANVGGPPSPNTTIPTTTGPVQPSWNTSLAANMSNSSQTPAPNVSTTVSTSSPKPASPTNQRVPAIQTSHTSTTLLPVVHRTFTTTAAPATSVRVPSPGQPQPAATDQSSPAPTSTSPALHTATAAQSRPPDAPTPPGGEGPVRGSVEEQLAAHLLDTSSLLALLLFGLLFFAVTVAMFTSQAYKSYKRKDYTQVDYLINGMYADSGV